MGIGVVAVVTVAIGVVVRMRGQGAAVVACLNRLAGNFGRILHAQANARPQEETCRSNECEGLRDYAHLDPKQSRHSLYSRLRRKNAT